MGEPSLLSTRRVYSIVFVFFKSSKWVLSTRIFKYLGVIVEFVFTVPSLFKAAAAAASEYNIGNANEINIDIATDIHNRSNKVERDALIYAMSCIKISDVSTLKNENLYITKKENTINNIRKYDYDLSL